MVTPTMPERKFRLSAKVSSDNRFAIKAVLERMICTKGTMNHTSDGFEIFANLKGESAKDLNRLLLSEMRRAEKKTRLRAERTFGDTVEKFFDYVQKGKRKIK